MSLPAFQDLGSEYHSLSQFLTKAILSEKISHAYLIKGAWAKAFPLTQALTQALLCPDKGCNSCQVCLSIQANQHPDFHVIQSESTKSKTISVKQIKALVSQVSLPPIQSPSQIFVIAEAEFMNAASANALLKTLEEPPSNSVMILTVSNLNQLLPTIRSRAQTLYLEKEATLSLDEEGLSFLNWASLLNIKEQAERFVFHSELEKLDKTTLLRVLEYYQSDCWQTSRQSLGNTNAMAAFRDTYRWLHIFEKSLEQLRSNANKKLILEFLSQDIWRMNRR